MSVTDPSPGFADGQAAFFQTTGTQLFVFHALSGQIYSSNYQVGRMVVASSTTNGQIWSVYTSVNMPSNSLGGYTEVGMRCIVGRQITPSSFVNYLVGEPVNGQPLRVRALYCVI
jgi:hypothetical protein